MAVRLFEPVYFYLPTGLPRVLGNQAIPVFHLNY